MNLVTLNELPADLLALIFTYNNDRDKHAVSMASKMMQVISSSQRLWKESAEKRGKALREGDNKVYVRDYIKKYNRLICKRFSEARTSQKDAFFAKELIDLKIQAKAVNLIRFLHTSLVLTESLETLYMILEAGAKPTVESLNWCIKCSPSIEKLSLLMKAGAPVTASALNNAILNQVPIEIINFLLKNGAKPEAATQLLAINTQASSDITATLAVSLN